MGWFSQSQEKSLLGQLLVRQKLISEEQLAQAIAQQRKTGQRLGDILAEWNLLTQHHIERALRKQRQLRLAAALVTALVAPIEALAVAPAPAAPVSVQTAGQEGRGGLLALSEDDLGEIAAQGLDDSLLHQVRSKDGGVKTLGKLVTAMNPVLDFLEADTTIKDVAYDPARARTTVNPDGSITLSMPSSIGEINFDNIRVKGDTSGASFGSISIKAIDFTGTTLTVAAHKSSR
ncbi:hypothetical protein [Noviherbaspirillum sp. UKPF54]|uniref:hypothetical protein n=1 Tax=Noviherbaspirillum sp. UKPF54 TaxID=2601898 RepID=UPI0011B18D41|nr:hypothetical protein [Noviherbaspirillum sp. UKPF54]QDZ29429.1 hypothetical protein FAY22_16560 [Noviherbaspirillum sp. UKPF54]